KGSAHGIISSGWSVAEPEHVEHVVMAGLPVASPKGCRDRAAGEDGTVAGAVGKGDEFAFAGDDDGMVAHHGAAAQRGKADRSGFARAGMSVANPDRVRREFDLASLCGRFAEKQGRAGRRI